MTDDKLPMQADGSPSTGGVARDKRKMASRPDGVGQTGESGGGAYPNPHTGKGGNPDGPDSFMGHGGQTDIAYSGPAGADQNAVTKK